MTVKEPQAAVAEEQQPMECIICLSEVSNEVGLLNCNHFYCFECISNWSEKENSCPLCKRRFTMIKKVSKNDVRAKLGKKTLNRIKGEKVNIKRKNQGDDFTGFGIAPPRFPGAPGIPFALVRDTFNRFHTSMQPTTLGIRSERPVGLPMVPWDIGRRSLFGHDFVSRFPWLDNDDMSDDEDDESFDEDTWDNQSVDDWASLLNLVPRHSRRADDEDDDRPRSRRRPNEDSDVVLAPSRPRPPPVVVDLTGGEDEVVPSSSAVTRRAPSAALVSMTRSNSVPQVIDISDSPPSSPRTRPQSQAPVPCSIDSTGSSDSESRESLPCLRRDDGVDVVDDFGIEAFNSISGSNSSSSSATTSSSGGSNSSDSLSGVVAANQSGFPSDHNLVSRQPLTRTELTMRKLSEARELVGLVPIAASSRPISSGLDFTNSYLDQRRSTAPDRPGVVPADEP